MCTVPIRLTLTPLKDIYSPGTVNSLSFVQEVCNESVSKFENLLLHLKELLDEIDQSR
jgi:hypothetical protein